MVYLTCAIIGLGGRGVIKTWTEVAARVRLYMLTSDLTSLVPPQFTVCFLFCFVFKLFSLGEFELCYVALPCLWKESNVKTEKNRKTRMINKMGS